MMKHFVVLLVVFVIACFAFPRFDFMKKTRHGEHQEDFKPLISKVLPYTLSNYILRNNVKFELAEYPNHVKDLFKYNTDFSIVYRSKPKYTLILIEPSDRLSLEGQSFIMFEDRLTKQLKYYPQDFNIIYRRQDTYIDYSNPYDKTSAEILLKYCRNFCLIDPSRNSIFVFKRLSNTEIEAVPVLLQEYHNLLK